MFKIKLKYLLAFLPLLLISCKEEPIPYEVHKVTKSGTVIDCNDNVVVLDDGTGKITAVFRDPVGVETGRTVRIFGRVMPAEDGFEIEGEFLQDMSSVDLTLYRKTVDLERGV